MKKIVIFSFALALSLLWAGSLSAQQTRPCDTPEGKQLDFWLGEWQLT